MSDIAIKVENLSKKYLIGHGQSGSLRETLSGLWHNTFGGQRTDEEEFWALRDVSFEIKQGEAVGIIGRNGAGKSTLLKLLSKITYPTSGKITMNGRVSSLLEVGTGFHPELTGRENIYLNGTILGMSRKEVKSKFDEIVAFSGVEKFLDTPVKRYSSGMYVRLAFAVAAHLEPEILIIDEVLAVGDAEFQKKCLGKMDEVAKGGRTVLFVSHNMGAVEQLCTSAFIMKSGQIIEQMSSVSHIVDLYLSQNNQPNRYFALENCNKDLWVETCYTRSGIQEKNSFLVNEQITLDILLRSNIKIDVVNIGVAMIDKYERRVLISEYVLDSFKSNSNEEKILLSLNLPLDIIAPGNYSFQIGVHIPNNKMFDYLSGVSSFEITALKSKFSNIQYETGIININCIWEKQS